MSARNANPVARASRRERRRAYLGGGNPCCPMCGETALECLEKDHLTGRKRDPDFVSILCRNCHRKITARRQDSDIPMLRESDLKSRTKQRLIALAVLREQEANQLRLWARELDQPWKEKQQCNRIESTSSSKN